MSLIKSEDSKKWINALLAVISTICGFIFISFLKQMGEWFDLEAVVPSFSIVVQVAGIAVGILIFVMTTKNKSTSGHLGEVYSELVKVVWPNKDEILKITIGLIFALSIVSGIFVMVDFGFRRLLQMIL